MAKVMKELGNPLAGCLPLLLQMPVLFALFATLRGSPFSDVPYNISLQILPQDQIAQIQPQAYTSSPQNIYISDGVHAPVAALIPGGTKLGVGEKIRVEFQTTEGKPLSALLADYPETKIAPRFEVVNGAERVKVNPDGSIEALQAGDVTLKGVLPGLAADKGFLFIDALGRVGAVEPDGTIHWDIVAMILFFGISIYVNQVLSGQGSSTGNSSQDTVNKLTPILFSGMFFFFPLPAGVLMYMSIANIFQTAQTFILSREPLPAEIQKIVDAEAKNAPVAAKKGTDTSSQKEKSASPVKSAPATKDSPASAPKKGSNAAAKKGKDTLPFEPGRSKKKNQGQ